MLYTADGFEQVGTFSTSSSLERWLRAHPGLYAVDHGDGRMRSVGSVATRADRQRSYEQLFAAHESASDTRGGGWAPGQFESARRAGRALTRRARTSELVGPRRADGSHYYQKPDGRGGSDDGRRGTGHKHPPGPRKCPKCGV